MYKVALQKLIDKMSLENCTPDVSIEGRFINQSEVNRPALQLSGFFEHFESSKTWHISSWLCARKSYQRI